MRYKRVFASLCAIVLLSAGCFGGGGGGASEDVILNVWMTFEDSENLSPLLQGYQDQYPNVQIVYTKKNVENYENDLLNALASGTGPDVFAIHNSWLPKYMDKAMALPAEYTDNTFNYTVYKDSFVDTVVRDFTKDNQIYGVALSVDSLALYYNKDLLGSSGIATPPKTWSELESHVQRIKRSDSTGYFTRSGVAMGTSANVNRAVDILYLLMLQQGVVPYDADGLRPTFADTVDRGGESFSPGQAALQFYTSFANPTTNNYNWNSRSDYSIDAFANGRAAFLLSYSYTRDTIKSKAPNLNFDVAPVPQPNLDDPQVNFANYWGVVVSKQSKYYDYAWDFLKFISSRDMLDVYYAQHKLPSSRKDLIEMQIQDPEIGVFAHANLTAKPFYRPDQGKIDSIAGKMIDAVILQGLSPEEAVREGQDQAEILIRE